MLKVGLVGCGHISTAHLKAWQKTPDCEVVGVFDLNPALAERQARKFKIKKIYEEIELLIDECEVVDVCTPPQTHIHIARQVIIAGRHLIIEKPLVTEVVDWEELTNLLSNSPSQITDIHNQKYLHSVLQAKQWVN
jgi:predicted dehydrogenase